MTDIVGQKDKKRVVNGEKKTVKIHLQHKTRPVYENCRIEAPDGSLLCTSRAKRLEWYLKRGLAEKTCDSPPTIRLLFQPKGNGDIDELKEHKRHNRCSVCGNPDKITLHHILPMEYRRHAPVQIKARASILVIPLCDLCHSTYEREARLFRKELEKRHLGQAAETHVPSMDIRPPRLAGLLRTLRSRIEADMAATLPPAFFDKIRSDSPGLSEELDRRLFLRSYPLKSSVLKWLDQEIDKMTPAEMRARRLLGKEAIQYSAARNIMDQVNQKQDWLAFSMTWLNHFVSIMKPQFLPPYLNEATLKKWMEHRMAGENMVLNVDPGKNRGCPGSNDMSIPPP